MKFKIKGNNKNLSIKLSIMNVVSIYAHIIFNTKLTLSLIYIEPLYQRYNKKSQAKHGEKKDLLKDYKYKHYHELIEFRKEKKAELHIINSKQPVDPGKVDYYKSSYDGTYKEILPYLKSDNYKNADLI